MLMTTFLSSPQLGINVFRQRLVISPVGPQAEVHEVLAALPGFMLMTTRMELIA